MLMGFCTETDLNSLELQDVNSLVNTLILDSLDRTGSDLTMTGDSLVSNGDKTAIDYRAPSGFQTFRHHSFIEAMIGAVLQDLQVHPDAEVWVREHIKIDGESVILTEKGLRYNLKCTTHRTGQTIWHGSTWEAETVTDVEILSVEEFAMDVFDDESFNETVIADHRGLDEYDAAWSGTRDFDVFQFMDDSDDSVMPGEIAFRCTGHEAEVGDTITVSEAHLCPRLNGTYRICFVADDWVHFEADIHLPEQTGFPRARITYRDRPRNIDYRPSVHDGEEWHESTWEVETEAAPEAA